MRERQMIFDPNYWEERRKEIQYPHQAIFRCTLPHWRDIEKTHKKILSQTIGAIDSILDVGCAWGRLLELLPKTWKGRYLGIDLCPGFISMAQGRHPSREFIAGDIRSLDFPDVFDWAVLISIKQMVLGNEGEEAWEKIRQKLQSKADKILYLEYSVENKFEEVS